MFFFWKMWKNEWVRKKNFFRTAFCKAKIAFLRESGGKVSDFFCFLLHPHDFELELWKTAPKFQKFFFFLLLRANQHECFQM